MNYPTPAVPPRRLRLFILLSLGLVLAITSVLPGDLFLSQTGTDLTGQFAQWRAFAADSIRAGHFPLWNPYSYAGQPFLGDFQSAELYPPNVIFLFLPLTRAVNLCFLLHLWWLAWGVYYWGTQRGFHPAAAGLAGFTAALCGPVFPHLFAGHVTNICALAWAPWILAWLEAARYGPARKPLLLAGGAIAIQILAGHPQYVFYTAIAAGLQALVYSVVDSPVRWRALPQVGAAYLMSVPLAAAQLLPGLAAVSESVRQGKLDFNFVRMFSFPLENLLTLLAPGFFGGHGDNTYWGRAYYWEVSIFIGVAGLVLAAIALFDREHRRFARPDFMVLLLLFWLALGAHTPLLQFLYDYMPGFGEFRSLAKFIFPATLLAIMTAAAGADALIRGRCGSRRLTLGVLGAGIAAMAMGTAYTLKPTLLQGFVDYVRDSHESYALTGQNFADASLQTAGTHAGNSLIVGGVLLAIMGAGLLFSARKPQLRYVPLYLWPVEMLAFAWTNVGISHTSDLVSLPVLAYMDAHPGDYRVLSPQWVNNEYFFNGKSDLWGNDPTVLKRYAEFITFTQGGDVEHPTQYVNFKFLPPIFSLIRFRMAILPQGNQESITDNPGALPRALLVGNYQVLPRRDDIFAALAKPDFNPRQTVLLETEPTPRPQPSATPGTVNLTNLTSDSLTIDADTPASAILLITDLYSRDWHARALPDSSQQNYDLLPGNYILRAIPLAAGHHHLVVEYTPPSFPEGLIISALAWLAWLAGWCWLVRPSKTATKT